ncbi:MAG: hypothetical protein WD075_02860 [Rhodospirillales bacterium]
MNYVRNLFYPLVTLVITVTLSSALWFWLGKPVDIVAVPDGRFDCLSYVPTTPDQHPHVSMDYDVPEGLIESDLKALLPFTHCIRTYSSYGVQGKILPIAARLDLKVLLGVWIGDNDKRNQVEIDAALAVAEKHPEAVRAIVVGNEVMLRREMSGERLAGIIKSVKARTSLPVTYADIYEFWRRNPVIAESVDMALVHVLPYWDDPTPVSIDDVQAQVRKVVDQMRSSFPDKDIEIGEIGWPSAGRTRGYAVPNRVNQAQFMREFTAQAGALGIRYNLIEAIDQPWKRGPEGTAGGYWGVLDQDRQLKFSLSEPVRAWPDWQQAALFSFSLSALFLILLRLIHPAPGLRQSLGAGMIGAATGTVLWMLYAQVQTLAVGVSGMAGTAYLMGIAAGGGLLLAASCAGLPGRWSVPAAPLASIIAGLSRRALTAAQILGLFRWAVLLPAVILAVLMAVDGRHRDFLTLAFMLPAAALAFQFWRTDRSRGSRTPEDAWMSLLLLVSGPLAIDVPGNFEAFGWAMTCLLLAVPGLPALAAEVRRLGRILSPDGEE